VHSSSPSLVSHGGAQSNAMLALAHLCHHNGGTLRYHTRRMPRWLRESPKGNLGAALQLGCVEIVEHGCTESYNAAVSLASTAPWFIPQGAAWPGAEAGVSALARRISSWHSCGSGTRVGVRQPQLHVIIPAGTGTTALFLARHLPDESIQVHAVPCVGGEEYLAEQMQRLDAASGAVGRFPIILPPSTRVAFGAPDERLLKSWRQAASSGCLLDLLYGPVAWSAMGSIDWPSESSLLYVNTGGQEGILSQLRRYRRCGLLAAASGSAEEELAATVCTAQRAAGRQLDLPPCH
jgi:1-aminocyclopropane-1-carboxylate deaminase